MDVVSEEVLPSERLNRLFLLAYFPLEGGGQGEGGGGGLGRKQKERKDKKKKKNKFNCAAAAP